MKLVKALNGDWVNVAQASSFNVADFGNRAVVYARVGNVSYEIFSAGWQEGLSAKASVIAAESFLDELFNRLDDVLNVPDNGLKSVFLKLDFDKPKTVELIKMMNNLETALGKEAFDELKEIADEKKDLHGVREVTAHIAPVMKSTKPVKRTTRKKADPDV